MFSKFKKTSLEMQLFWSFFFLSLFLLSFSLVITITSNMKRQRENIDQNISNIASYIASMEQVKEMLSLGYPTEDATHALDALHDKFSELNVIVIYNTNNLRFYHTNRQTSGESLLDGEEKAILSGSEPYITTGYGTHGSQRRAFHAIKNEKGDIIGFVMTSVFSSYISRQEKSLIFAYLPLIAAMFLFSAFLSDGIVRLLRNSLMGHHPEELLDLYLKQDTVLNALDEGIIASDQRGKVIFANEVAKKLFLIEELNNKLLISNLFPLTESKSILKSGTPILQQSCEISNRSLIYSELPIKDHAKVHGVLTVFTDRSEVEKLSDELSGTKSMLDTLRSFNHEFLNKLHVILGYLQTDQTDKAITFITNSTLVSSQSIRQTADCLRVSQICALVIGKKMHAAELGIILSVFPDSHCTSKDLLLPIDAYVTIIGNLLENAIEELANHAKEEKEIHLGIYFTPDCSIITCEDTGNGIDKKLLPHIYEMGISSKGQGRGTGLYLIHQLVTMHHGEIQIDTEEGEGSYFTVTFTRKEIT